MTARSKSKATEKPSQGKDGRGERDELEQIAGDKHPALTTNHGVAFANNQNSLRATPLGPTLLEDFILRERTIHFYHERIS